MIADGNLTTSQEYWTAWKELVGSIADRSRHVPTFHRSDIGLMIAGSSENALALAVSHGKFWLVNATSYAAVADEISRLRSAVAQSGSNNVDLGIRLHVLIRQSENEVWKAAQVILQAFRHRGGLRKRDRQPQALDAREYICGDHLWNAIGRLASGPGLTIIGTPEQVRDGFIRFHEMGVKLFILSGYDNELELDYFLAEVKPLLP